MFDTQFPWQPETVVYLTYICAVCTQTCANHLLLWHCTVILGLVERLLNESIGVFRANRGARSCFQCFLGDMSTTAGSHHEISSSLSVFVQHDAVKSRPTGEYLRYD